jgi:hypothetical protein
MTDWTLHNRSLNCRPIPVESGDHAVELLWKNSGWPDHSDYGVILEFVHAERGIIICFASTEFSTIEFIPDYTDKTRSRAGSRSGLRVKPVTEEPFYFVCGGCKERSSVWMRNVLPIVKVTRAVKHIIENRNFPGGIRWTDPVPESPSPQEQHPTAAESLWYGHHTVKSRRRG